MRPIIKVENLSKRYKLGGGQQARGGLSESVLDFVRSPLKTLKDKQKSDKNGFWALKDVNFEIMPGEVVGIIGRNGAGKSTLLKILSRITKPTTGKIELYGRIESLLEVGTGFHPELTGRENIFLNGAILGMRREEISKKFDEIVDFAEIEQFLETPVKFYSSGMYVRLAFAVAAHLEPEVLIIDEVLAVGDAEFQKKCLGKMDEVSKTGRTILFVSHQMGTIAQLCRTSILLEKGELLLKDATASVIASYLQLNQNSENFYQSSVKDQSKSAYFEYVKMVGENGEIITALEHDKPLIIEFEVKIKTWSENLSVGFSLQDAMQKRIFTIHHPLEKRVDGAGRPAAMRLRIPGNFLTPGQYSWIVAAFVQGRELIDAQWNICGFSIIDAGTSFAGYEGVDYGCIFIRDYSFETIG